MEIRKNCRGYSLEKYGFAVVRNLWYDRILMNRITRKPYPIEPLADIIINSEPISIPLRYISKWLLAI